MSRNVVLLISNFSDRALTQCDIASAGNINYRLFRFKWLKKGMTITADLISVQKFVTGVFQRSP